MFGDWVHGMEKESQICGQKFGIGYILTFVQKEILIKWVAWRRV